MSNGGAVTLYLELTKQCLTRLAFPERYRSLKPVGWLKRSIVATFRAVLNPFRLELVRRASVDRSIRELGRDIPFDAETMIGLRRLDNLQDCIVDVLQRGVPGDLIEAGVWRGGAAIFMRAVLKAYGDSQRRVWVADSFEGLPPVDPSRSRHDEGGRNRVAERVLAVSQAEVEQNFGRYGLLDEQVRFLPGWFDDTLPVAPIRDLAVMRLDGDLYSSTMVSLQTLYPKLSVGGYAIVDDYGDTAGCRAATDDFRAAHGITEELQHIDQTGVFWKRSH